MKKIVLIFCLVTASAMLLSSFDGSASNKTSSPNEVTIGKQVWMAENLNVDRFRNGDAIPEAKTADEWEKAGENKQAAWCYYDNDPANGAKYGKLYNWYAVNDPRGLAPKGWHVPSDGEWTVLIDYLGGGKEAGVKMKSIHGWAEEGNGTNSSGFSGLPGGFRFYYGSFDGIGNLGYWWSSGALNAWGWGRYLGYGSGDVDRNGDDGKDGFSVRCLRD